MPDLVTEATLTPTTDDHGRPLNDNQQGQRRVDVHFNPESLNITVSNTVQKGTDNQPAQVVTDSVSKLAIDLIFDTTTSGADVRTTTHKIVTMMDPVQETSGSGNQSQTNKVPAVVVFEWGTTRFEGYIDSYKENIEFFSQDGIPLRATVNLSITQQERTFSPIDAGEPVDVDGTLTVSQAGQSLDKNTDTEGDSEASKQVANQNGIENRRFPEKNELFISNESGRGPVSFSAGMSASASLSGGLDIGASAGIGINAGISIGGSAAFDVGIKQSATAQAFAGLHLKADITPIRPRKKLGFDFEAPTGIELGISNNTKFNIGGKIKTGNSSMSANVGASASIGIKFED